MKLELGAGTAATAGYVHHDKRRHSAHIDVCHDLDQLPIRAHAVQCKWKVTRIGASTSTVSPFSLVGFPQFAAYNAAKGGILQLTRTLASEWAGLGVNVNAIGPTAIRTELNAYLLDDESFLEFFLPKVPAGRVGQTDDVVGAALFLASSASDFVHGHLLLVDGGYTAV